MIAPAGSGATLTPEDGTDLDDIQTNSPVVFVARPAAGHRITRIRFYDGHGNWCGEEGINPEDDENMYDPTDGSVHFLCFYYHNDDLTRVLSVYAELQIDGQDTWTSTNVLQFTVKTPHGYTGAYDFESLEPTTASQGEIVTLTFTESMNATQYWADVFNEWDGNYNPWTYNSGRTVRINTANIPEGTYTIRGRAPNTEEPGWRMRFPGHLQRADAAPSMRSAESAIRPGFSWACIRIKAAIHRYPPAEGMEPVFRHHVPAAQEAAFSMKRGFQTVVFIVNPFGQHVLRHHPATPRCG